MANTSDDYLFVGADAEGGVGSPQAPPTVRETIIDAHDLEGDGFLGAGGAPPPAFAAVAVSEPRGRRCSAYVIGGVTALLLGCIVVIAVLATNGSDGNATAATASSGDASGGTGGSVGGLDPTTTTFTTTTTTDPNNPTTTTTTSTTATTTTTTRTHTTPLTPFAPLVLPPGTATLPATAPGQVLRLEVRPATARRATGCDGPPVAGQVALARSFDGGDWTPLTSESPLAVACSGGSGCTVTIPGSGATYCVLQVDTSGVPSGPEAVAARLLAQATFGPTEASIAHMVNTLGNNATAFVEAQLAMPASTLREYLRARRGAKLLSLQNEYGAIRSACEVGARWHNHALQLHDVGETLTVTLDKVTPGWYALEVDGLLVTELDTWTEAVGAYTVCTVAEFLGVGGPVTIHTDPACPRGGRQGRVTIGNPAVHFETPNANALDFSGVALTAHPTRSDVVFTTGPAAPCAQDLFGTDTFMCRDAACTDYYRYDPRAKVLENSYGSPVTTTHNTEECASAPKTIFNEMHCIKTTSCSSTSFGSAPVAMELRNLRSWFRRDGRYVYQVTQLRLEDAYAVSPCSSGSSRWKVDQATTCPSATALSGATLATIRAALLGSTDVNPFVRDISLTGVGCTDMAGETIGAQVQVGPDCFTHVHPNELDVRDFTAWVQRHDGGNAAITQFAMDNTLVMLFPASHPMSRWRDRLVNFPLVGRWGDDVDFTSLSSGLQTVNMATRVGALVTSGAVSESCGSPGEVADQPTLGSWFVVSGRLDNGFEVAQTEYPIGLSLTKSAVWTTLAHKAPDQLRQRWAWAMSQIFVAGNSAGLDPQVEPWTVYYDIMTRHAFGNFRSMMQEVSYSPVMGIYLTYFQNQAYAFTRNFPDENYAREIMQLFSIGLFKLRPDGSTIKDANGNPLPTYTNDDIVAFARIWTGFDQQPARNNFEAAPNNLINVIDPMQIKPDWRDRLPKTALDTGYIGDGYPLCHELPSQEFLRDGAIYELTGANSIEGERLDAFRQLPDEVFQAEAAAQIVGTVRPGVGVIFATPNTDLIEFQISRAAAQTVELRAFYYSGDTQGRFVRLEVNGVLVNGLWRFPGAPSVATLAATAPENITLNAGANTIRLAAASIGGPWIDYIGFGGSGAIRSRLTPRPATSMLHRALCAPNAGSGECSFPSLVTIAGNLPCDGPQECGAGRVLTVAVDDPVSGARMFYTHRTRPCVRLSLFGDGRVTRRGAQRQCTSEKAPVSPLCCASGTSAALPANVLAGDVLFANEAVSYATAAARCSARGGGVCSTYDQVPSDPLASAAGSFVWTMEPCHVQVQVYRDLTVGLVDTETTDDVNHWEWMASTGNTFKTRWVDPAAAPTPANGCGAGCAVRPAPAGDTCLCNVTVTETVPFPDSQAPPTAAEAADALAIGGVAPLVHGAGVYVRCTACPAGYTVWTLASDNGAWTRSTIFELPPRRAGGSPRYRMNQLVMVQAGSGAFRNPPAFMPGLGEQTVPGQAYHSADLLRAEAGEEVEALLTHLFEHDSTAPFVARRAINNLVSSNPSPAYMTAVSTAFTTGSYAGFGSGRYGDLAATAAAVLLHREARTPSLDADPSFGRGVEPLPKLIALLRAMEWAPSLGQDLSLDTFGAIGEEAFHQPSVFGFFLPEFTTGPAEDAGLLAPELQLAQTPLLIGYLNGMVTLLDNGLSACGDGFGGLCVAQLRNRGYDGRLTWAPASQNPAAVVDRLALLLTQDRLQAAARNRIASAYATQRAATNAQDALVLAQKLILMMPDASTTGINRPTGTPQPSETPTPSQGRPYKAIVVLFMQGGCDSFNLLVPHSHCVNGDGSAASAPAGSFAEYEAVRGANALGKASLLPVNVSAGAQPCGTYGVHGSLPAYQQLYEAGDGAFIANMGPLVEPVSKDEYLAGAKRVPASLFAHNFQQLHLSTVNAENVNAKGVLGRTVQSLREQAVPFASNLYSIAGNQRMLEGVEEGAYEIIDEAVGAKAFSQYGELRAEFEALTANVSGSVFADTYAKLIRASLAKTEALGAQLDSVTPTAAFADDTVSRQLEQVAKLIALRGTLQSERDVFVVARGDFDTHASFDISPMLSDISAGLGSFVEEMKAQGLWDDVVFFTVSDFARTLTSNGAGTDHAWGGNHFVAGGGIDGGKIHGQFPDTLGEAGSLNIGRGRLIPTLPWEYVWSGVAEWFGVSPADLSTVLPLVNNFGAAQRTDSAVGGQSLFGSGRTSSAPSPPGPPAGPANHPIAWSIPASPRTVTAAVGDLVTFTWTGSHDVQSLPNPDCNFAAAGAQQLAAVANGGTFTWTAPATGTFHFGCSVGSHCSLGQAVTVTVA